MQIVMLSEMSNLYQIFVGAESLICLMTKILMKIKFS